MTPLVSAIIPAYNGARVLGDALASVFAQEYPNLEVLVVDDGSTDETASVVAAFEQAIYLRQENRGVAAARNRAIEASCGDLLAFLDQDDVWLPEKLRTQVAYLENNPEVECVLAHQRMFVEAGAVAPPWIPAALLERDHPGWFPGTLVARRSAFDTVGLYKETAPPAESADWLARARDANVPMTMLDDVLLLKRIHGDNQSNDIASVRRGVLAALKDSIDRKRGVT